MDMMYSHFDQFSYPASTTAMFLAMDAHKHQKRKYTGEPYFKHLAEVVGLVSTALDTHSNIDKEIILATAWLHDLEEDAPEFAPRLHSMFQFSVKLGVSYLTNDKTLGENRSERHAKYVSQLESAPGWVQTIKIADIISNTMTIRMHDPKFAGLYLQEKRETLKVFENCGQADMRLLKIAKALCR